MAGEDGKGPGFSKEQVREENRKIRAFRLLTDLTFQRLSVERMTLAEARDAVEELRAAAQSIFPGKQSVFDIVIAPRMERVIKERFGDGSAPVRH